VNRPLVASSMELMLRLLPDEPLPPYTYVPGRAPHPVTDPRGHLYGHSPPPATPLEPAQWRECRAFVRGIDHFNAGYYWEAHEAWEAVWHAVGRGGAKGDFLKGLIKLAAAGVKAYEGRPEGVRRHARRAMELWTSCQTSDGETFLPLGIEQLLVLAAAALRNAAGLAATEHDPPVAGLLGLYRPE
jgi:hypothetical protein